MIYPEKLYEVVTWDSGSQEIKWPVVASSKRKAMKTFRFFAPADVPVLSVKHVGAAMVYGA
jgi:nitrate reductase NapE component